ncbi:MAG TPA: pyruvate dehydrogenase [Candidatus Omnitrophica bacterium]|nr:pyruvate dehydrogenase [Candidatus Omnitrophota bacterium]
MVKEKEISFEYKPTQIDFPSIPVFTYQKSLSEELEEGTLTSSQLIDFLEDMLIIRTLEEMVVEIKGGSYSALPGFDFKGPTHLSIGQEATACGSISALSPDDYITSSHRGHGDALSKGYFFIKSLDKKGLENFLNRYTEMVNFIGMKPHRDDDEQILQEKAISLLVYRTICELFGKKDGYCRGVGGSMHIADFSVNHLGANAIVGGHMGIATGAGIASRYRRSNEVVLCLAGDGAYSNGISHESMNLATMSQFKNGLMGYRFGVPVIFGIVNNQYCMSGQSSGEVTGVDFLARRASAYDTYAMHAEVVDGMDILAVRDATRRAVTLSREGKGPVLIEFMTYRFKGHSLHDPLTYRTKEELRKWEKRDPIENFSKKLLESKTIDEKKLESLRQKVWRRNEVMAKKAVEAPPPSAESMLSGLYAGKRKSVMPPLNRKSSLERAKRPKFQRDNEGRLTIRLAIREALVEEMEREERIILFGEDIAEYGGAFGVTGELLKYFGRERVFNTSISEAGIVGSAVGMAMAGLCPVAEIMYCDFILQAMDQIGNQAAKWQYMSGAQITLPLVIRCAIGGGRGYAGQHSQSLESITTHIPGLIVIAPSTAYDSKGLLKSAIRDENPVIFFEHQLLYNNKDRVPEEDYTVPIGKAQLIRKGKDITIICWSYTVRESLKAAENLNKEGIDAEIIDLRTLIPLDLDTLLESVKKTSRVIVTSQAVEQGSFVNEVAFQIQQHAFDFLDCPVHRLGSVNGIPPSSFSLEEAYLPNSQKLVNLTKRILGS